jgi:hypothetical protein
VIGLYDHQGVLRFAGRDTDDCLDYADLFGLGPDGYSLMSLSASVELPQALSAGAGDQS